ncbi:MAG: hypothetical protein AAFX99_32950 [Myxococcota bacterium]
MSQDAQLGYRIDRDHVLDELWVRQEQDNLVHIMSPLIPTDAIPWLMLEAEFQRARQMELLNLTDATMPRATIHWYRNREHKRQITGAARTKFAKVHLGELYISAETFPPRVLGHELAHITSGAFSDNLLRVPGRLGGLWYNPALVEGFAVAVDSSDTPLSTHEKTRVALDADRVPPLQELFSPLGFVNTNLSVAYRASGSFVRYCLDTWGAEPVIRWFGTEHFERSMGLPLSEAEHQWRAWLAELELRQEDIKAVQRIQTRPAIGQEKCGRSPEAIALDRARQARADEAFERFLAQLEPEMEPDALWLTRTEYKAIRAQYRCTLPDPPPISLTEERQTQYTYLLALTDWARGDTAEAQLRLNQTPDSYKRSDHIILTRVLLRDGFDVGLVRSVDDVRDEHVLLTQAWERTRHPAVGFLLALRMARQQHWRSLAEVLDQIDWTGFAFPEDTAGTILLRTQGLRGRVAFAQRDWASAAASWRAYTEAAPTQGRRDQGETWLARTRFFESRAARLKADLPAL